MEQTRIFKVWAYHSLGTPANILIVGGKYGTALQAASYEGGLELVKLLLEREADVNAQGTSPVIPKFRR
jgi:hypothetical protein